MDRRATKRLLHRVQHDAVEWRKRTSTSVSFVVRLARGEGTRKPGTGAPQKAFPGRDWQTCPGRALASVPGRDCKTCPGRAMANVPRQGTGKRSQAGNWQASQAGTASMPRQGMHTGKRSQAGNWQASQAGTANVPRQGTGKCSQAGNRRRPQAGDSGCSHAGNCRHCKSLATICHQPRGATPPPTSRVLCDELACLLTGRGAIVIAALPTKDRPYRLLYNVVAARFLCTQNTPSFYSSG